MLAKKNCMRKFSYLIFFLLIFGAARSQSDSLYYTYEEGDLWFQDLDCGEFCDAIEKVTQGVNGAKFSHMGLLVKHQGEWGLLEAVSAGVVITNVPDFLKRSKDKNGNPKVVAARMNKELVSVQRAVNRALSYVGRPYDDVFDLNNEGLYCSELIYFSFIDEY
jgi:uncharacterized protein YycO